MESLGNDTTVKNLHFSKPKSLDEARLTQGSTCTHIGAIHTSIKEGMNVGACHPSVNPKTPSGSPDSDLHCLDAINPVKPPKPPAGESHLVRMVSKVLASVPPQIHPPFFRFEKSAEAATHNTEILRQHNMSFSAAITAGPFTPCSPGSEFRPTNILADVFACHPTWDKFKTILDHGSSFPMDEIDEETRLKDLQKGLARGNHKSAKGEREKILVEKFKKEVRHGWALPLDFNCASVLPLAMFAPMGLAEQSTINASGEFIPKNRPTHDQSFRQLVSNKSMNERIEKDKLADCHYGHMLLHSIHYIVGCRHRHPFSPILISKTDLDSAYRRGHVNESALMKSLCGSPLVGHRYCFCVSVSPLGARLAPPNGHPYRNPSATLQMPSSNVRPGTHMNSPRPSKRCTHQSTPSPQISLSDRQEKCQSCYLN